MEVAQLELERPFVDPVLSFGQNKVSYALVKAEP